MSVFSQAELAYFNDGAKLGRLATVDATGAPHVVPVGWNYNPEHDTIDIGGRDFASTRKYRNVLANPKVCFVVDDVLPPFRPRCVQVRGEAEALAAATWPDGRPREAIIRIYPKRVVSWGLDAS
jgi:pyridoxamine 5'-phosphate oxidase family protein